jgi:hypothetical protein
MESHIVGQPPLDPRELLERLRSEHETLQWEPLAPDEARHTKDGPNSERSSLDYLHRHWALPDHFDPAEAGAGIRGRIVMLFGRLTYRVLGSYLRQERDLLAHMVQVNEALERRCDELTLRCRQLGEDFTDRQVAESRNLTELALWLNLAHPLTSTSSEFEENKGEPGQTTSES